jgi:hypothetical protein
VPGKADEEIFPNQGWVWGGIPHIGKIPHCSLEEGGKKKKEKRKREKRERRRRCLAQPII